MQTERTPLGATFTGKPQWCGPSPVPARVEIDPRVPDTIPRMRRDARDLTPSRLAILKRLYDAGGTVTVNGRSWPAVRFLTDVGFTAYVVRSYARRDAIAWVITDAGRAALKMRDARYG